jgi:glycosyltransferase involved in cell wall biosynthesis
MKAHILVVADGRSPTAQSWIENILALDYQVSLISTYPCKTHPGLAHFHVLPVSFSRFSSGTNTAAQPKRHSTLKSWVRRLAPAFQTLRYQIGPLTLHQVKSGYLELVKGIDPDLVHALRIPFEGMLASAAPKPLPLAVAIWGNDLTLHAKGSLLMKRWTHRCLARADALSADTNRDIRLAKGWGLDADAHTLVVPGSGGLDLAAIQNAKGFENKAYGIPDTGHWIVNPRGVRPGSVHQQAFFAAIPKVLARRPEAVFICPGLKGVRAVEGWVRSLGVEDQTFLLPHLPQVELWSLMKRALLFVSPSSHDGTPNSFLEALACGCFPIVGDIESLREWIHPRENGLLTSPQDPNALAEAILWVLDHPEIRESAVSRNRSLIQERAARKATRPQIDSFYLKLLN